MSLPHDLQREHPGLGDWAVLVGYRGSIAHGTYVPNDDPTSIDDKDAMAFCVPPAPYYLGLRQFGSRGTQEIVSDPWDVVIYEARKAVGLLQKGNPNVLSMLWLEDTLYTKRERAGEMLIEHRDVFVGKHVYRAFGGYAVSQLRKMEQGVYKGYMGDKRRILVEKYGYDTKNASHLIRLLRQGIEFLNDGHLYVQRHDASELLAIKQGEWKLDRVKAEAERLFGRLEDAYDRSKLPVKPDADAVNDLCVAVVEGAWAARTSHGTRPSDTSSVPAPSRRASPKGGLADGDPPEETAT